LGWVAGVAVVVAVATAVRRWGAGFSVGWGAAGATAVVIVAASGGVGAAGGIRFVIGSVCAEWGRGEEGSGVVARVGRGGGSVADVVVAVVPVVDALEGFLPAGRLSSRHVDGVCEFAVV